MKRLGTKVVMVNPYREPGMDQSGALDGFQRRVRNQYRDYWFPVSTGGDIAFLSGVLKILIANGWVDETFVRDHTTGKEDLKRQIAKFEWEELESRSGLSHAAMQEFAELIHNANTGVLVWSMGITQHATGGDAVWMILNLGLLRGWVGRDKCGLMPIRGHSSVQGGAEMGAYATAFPGGKPINAENAAKLSEQYGFTVPDWTGLSATEMVEAAERGDLDLFYCLGEISFGHYPSRNASARRWPTCPCACIRTSLSPTRCSSRRSTM